MSNVVGRNASYPPIENSQALWERGSKKIPCGTQTLAKGPGQYVKGVAPMYLERGEGARVWDVDGNEFLDCNMAIGPLVLGYKNPTVDAAIRKQLDSGITFSLMHPMEVEVAELVSSVVPGAESVRFSKTGCDATSAAIRVARAFTGRKKIAQCGYHGWHDWYIGTTSRNAGIPEEVKSLTKTFSYNDIASLEAIVDSDTAAVILEPMLFDFPKEDFLFKVRELCTARGALLIFDEMWTGFRFALGGAQQYFDVRADLATFSKAVANGMPISVLSGRADVMAVLEKDVFFFTTFGGEALSLAAAKATIETLRDGSIPAKIEKLGDHLREGFTEVAAKLDMPYVRCHGHGSRTMVSIDGSKGNVLEMKSVVQQEMIRCGVLWQGMHALSAAHKESDIDYLLEVYREESLPALKSALASGDVKGRLRGEPVQPVFRTVTGQQAPKKA